MTLDFGFHRNIEASRYHADDLHAEPTLSSSLAKVMLTQTPKHARLAHPRLNPAYEAPDDAKFDVGSVAHELALGKGGGFAILPYGDYRKKEAQEARAAAVLAGKTPILTEQYVRAEAVASTVLREIAQVPGCEGFFEGESEIVALWQDIGGPVCRAMLDKFDGAVIWDLKTTEAGLNDGVLARQIANLSYDLSAAFYVRAVTHLLPDLAGRVRFRWIFCEVDEPNEIRVIEADNATLTMGDKKCALAIEKWRACIAADRWPGYPRQIGKVDYPSWAENAFIEREMADPDAMRAVTLNSARPIERKVEALAGPC